MKSVIVIPARLESTRLPRKLLLNMGSKSVLRHTWDKCCKVQSVTRVVVATDSAEIEAEVKSWGGTVIMTPSSCRSGTERIGEALQNLDEEFILNVQGDEPFIDPQLLEAIIKRASETECDLITAVSRIRDLDDLFNENVVKAVRSNDGRAVFFTRSPCPFVRGVSRAYWLDKAPYYRHIGVYGYKKEVVEWYRTAQPSSLEQMESLEQLRFVDQGWNFQTIETDYAPEGIDTAEDLEKGIARLSASKQVLSEFRSPSKSYEVARKTVYLEIEELEKVLIRNRKAIEQTVELILSCEGKVVVTGIGKSGIIGHKISATFASTGTPSVFLNSAEALHGDLGMIQAGDVVVMVSNSAQTEELIHMLPSLRKIGTNVIGMFGRLDTALAKQMKLILDISVKREACPLNLAPMSSTTNTLVLGDCIAAAVMEKRKFSKDEFAKYHPKGALGKRLLLTAGDVMQQGYDLPKGKPSDTMRDVLIELTRTNLGAVPIVDDKNIVGIITDGDIRRFVMSENDFNNSVESVMTGDAVTVSMNYPLLKVLELMERPERQITVVPVVNNLNEYVGIVRIHDIL